ncbi:hypothetical protein VOLCADRAFT_97964 [Volvox carteri f. nagariensis]|uniref:Uncharacterized protein n=1 Tax=Volvox carteri f. nagariensis TaxID=3068 RepID=D8UE33_VOLCA|nr:uncharacterized protein VOLCADRAFT_97964 [Volvox carteri f. nagariensis]EFJ42021.1 hypothetical protein VOLCADRAFT_97964 [Volvox carteri f. nagariensis]|eukprot:XP_002956896.1 hypothetical protein VOLCADRAFT_97964 [Volvox carteri f. nagariensis]
MSPNRSNRGTIRGTLWSQYHYGQLQSYSGGQLMYLTQEHRIGVKIASANAQHHLVRMALCKALCAVLRRAPVEELVLGLRLSESGCTMLSEALATNSTLKRLSFAGSHMGDERVRWLKPGLIGNNTLEELDLTACNLTDAAARDVAAVIKAHVDRRLNLAFDEQLRHYPDTSLPRHRAHLEHHAQLRLIARQVDQAAGGLLHLELAENKLKRRIAPRVFSAALGFQPNPSAPALHSPSRTDTSMPMWALREELPDSIGPTPLVTPRHASLAAPSSPGHMSTVSWGDRHLLARGAPSSHAGVDGGDGGRSRSRNDGKGNGNGRSGNKAELLLQRASSVDRRRPPDVGESSGGGIRRAATATGVLTVPASPQVRIGPLPGAAEAAAPSPPPLRQQQGLAPGSQLEQFWANREATLSGEPAAAAAAVAPGANGVYDTPQPRGGRGDRTGAGDSDAVLHASGPGAMGGEAVAAAAASAPGITPVPLVSSGDSFGFGFNAVHGSGAMSPRSRAQRGPQVPVLGLGTNAVAPGSPSLGRSFLSRVNGSTAGGTGGGSHDGVAWVWGRPVNPDGSDMVVLSAVAAPPPQRPQSAAAAPLVPDVRQHQQARRQTTSPPRPRPYEEGAAAMRVSYGGGGAAAAAVGSPGSYRHAVQPPTVSPAPQSPLLYQQPGTGWVPLPDGSGMAWLAMPVPVTGLHPYRTAGAAAPSQRSYSPFQGQQPQRPHTAAAATTTTAAVATHGFVPPGYRGQDALASPVVPRGAAGVTFDAAAMGGGGGGMSAAATAADSQRQGAFVSMLHREGLAAGRDNYDYLFTKQRLRQKQDQQQQQQRRRRRGSPTSPGGGRGGCGGGPGGASRKPHGSAVGVSGGFKKSFGVRSGLKRRQPATSTATATATATSTPFMRSRRETPRTGRTRTPIRSSPPRPFRPRPQSPSRSSSSPPHVATPTRHYARSRGGGGGGASPTKSRSAGRTFAKRVDVGGYGGYKCSRSLLNSTAPMTLIHPPPPYHPSPSWLRSLPPGHVAGPPGCRCCCLLRDGIRDPTTAATATAKRVPGHGPLGAAAPQALLALEQSLMQMAADVTALEAAADASKAAVAAAAEREAAERASAVHAGREAALAAIRAAAAAEAAERAAAQAVDRAVVAERRAKDAVRRFKGAAKRSASPSPRAGVPTSGVSEEPKAGVATQTAAAPPSPPLLVQLQPHSSVRPYEGAKRASGVNVNTIIQQLDRWCGLCDHALLQPESSRQLQPRHHNQPHHHQQPQPQPQQPYQSQTQLHPQAQEPFAAAAAATTAAGPHASPATPRIQLPLPHPKQQLAQQQEGCRDRRGGGDVLPMHNSTCQVALNFITRNNTKQHNVLHWRVHEHQAHEKPGEVLMSLLARTAALTPLPFGAAPVVAAFNTASMAP